MFLFFFDMKYDPQGLRLLIGLPTTTNHRTPCMIVMLTVGECIRDSPNQSLGNNPMTLFTCAYIFTLSTFCAAWYKTSANRGLPSAVNVFTRHPPIFSRTDIFTVLTFCAAWYKTSANRGLPSAVNVCLPVTASSRLM